MFRFVGVKTAGRLTKMPFYAVRVGRETGIFNSWAECKERVDGVIARFKKFGTLQEAQTFMNAHDPTDYRRRPFTAGGPSSRLDNAQQEPRQYSQTFKRKYSYQENFQVPGKRQRTEVTDLSRPVVYSDGCCTRNGRKNAFGGIGVFWGDDDPSNVSEPLQGPQTNQRAELNAAIRAVETACAKNLDKVEVRTDSLYTLNAVTDWMGTWKRNGFKTAAGKDVKNKQDIVKLYNLCQKVDVKWTHVRGHSNVYGNEKADELAKLGSRKSR